MPDITFNCPHCNQSLEVPESLIGSTITCPACQKSITLEADAPPPVAVQPQPSLTIKRLAPPMQKPSQQASKPVTGPIIFDCPHCQAELEAESDQVGTKLDCPKCSAVLTVPYQSKKPSLRPKKQSWTRKCPQCAEEIQQDAAMCRFCGAHTHPACEASFNRVAQSPHNESTGTSLVTTLGEALGDFTKVVLVMALIGGVISIGFFRVYHGGGMGFKIVTKDSYSFTDTVVNLDDIFAMPRIAVAAQHPAVKRQLERMKVIKTDEECRKEIEWQMREKMDHETRRIRSQLGM